MTVVEKVAYYEGHRIPAPLARRYFRLFGDGTRILDLGCGVGDLGRCRPSPRVEVVGNDSDAMAVAQAHLPFEDASFDAVLARDILEHIYDPLPLVCEAVRVLNRVAYLLFRCQWQSREWYGPITRTSAALREPRPERSSRTRAFMLRLYGGRALSLFQPGLGSFRLSRSFSGSQAFRSYGCSAGNSSPGAHAS